MLVSVIVSVLIMWMLMIVSIYVYCWCSISVIVLVEKVENVVSLFRKLVVKNSCVVGESVLNWLNMFIVSFISSLLSRLVFSVFSGSVGNSGLS